MFFRFFAIVFCSILILPSGADARSDRPAKYLFGHADGAAKMKPRPIGFYTKGCLAGGKELAKTGPAWQAMRLSRNRNWGHPVLIDFLEKLAVESQKNDGWPGLLVGDLSQPRGGPMLTGHRSHQIGLDADIWLTPMPKNVQTYQQRESRSAISMLAKGGLKVHPKKWSLARARLIKRAASSSKVGRIFVHPAIKKALCEASDKIGTDRSWLRRVRPWWGHHYHFHVRLNCPRGLSGCKNQPLPPVGDGCGKPVQAWLDKMDPSKRKKIVRKKPKKKLKRKKRRQLTLASLPVACTAVITKGNKMLTRQLRAGKIVGKVPVPARNPRRAAKAPQNMIEKLINGLKGQSEAAAKPVAATNSN